MNRIKPQRIVIEDEVKEEKSEEKIKPQKFENIDYKIEDEFEELESSSNLPKKKKRGFKLSIFLIAFLLFFGLLLYDTTYYIISIYITTPFIGSIFIILAILLIFLIFKNIYQQIVSIFNLKSIENRQKESLKLKNNPTKEVKEFILDLISYYKKSYSEEKSLKELERKIIDDELLNNQMIERFEKEFLSKLDEKALLIIHKTVNQTAVATAISPVALIDALFVLYRNITMITQIAKIYGFNPTLTFKISLGKKILNAIVFASAAELISEYGSYLLGNSLIKKFSLSISDGIANGILTARIGFYTIKACRPIEDKTLQKNKLKKVLNSMMEEIFKGAKGE